MARDGNRPAPGEARVGGKAEEKTGNGGGGKRNLSASEVRNASLNRLGRRRLALEGSIRQIEEAQRRGAGRLVELRQRLAEVEAEAARVSRGEGAEAGAPAVAAAPAGDPPHAAPTVPIKGAPRDARG